MLNHIEEEFIKNDLKLSPVALKEYTSLCATVGRDITFTKDGKSVTAKAVGVNPDGELIAELPDKTTKLINQAKSPYKAFTNGVSPSPFRADSFTNAKL